MFSFSSVFHSYEEMGLERTACCWAAVPACSPRGEALWMQRVRIPTQKQAAVRRQMTMPGSRNISAHHWPAPLSSALCLENIKVFFSFSYVVEYFMHKGNNHIPKREQLSCLTFVVILCYLLNRETFVWWNFLSTHTVPVGPCTSGSWQCRDAERCCSDHSAHYQPLGTHPCAQAIIVNDKVTIEVIIVLN